MRPARGIPGCRSVTAKSRAGAAMSKVEHEDDGKRADSAGPESADTVPGAPAGPRFDEDATFRELSSYASAARQFLAARAWDNLAHIERFARALTLAADVVSR